MPCEDDCSNCCWCLCALWCVVLVVIPFLAIAEALRHQDPLYSAAINSFSGLDDADLARRPTDLNPLFNLTLRVTTRRFFSSGCTHPGAVVEVTYAGFRLAAGPVQRFCAKPRKAKEMTVEAWGTAVQVPEFALDRLVEDARGGVRAFDVVVTMPSTHHSDHHGKLVACKALQVGDGAALGAPCAVSDVDTVWPCPAVRTAVRRPKV